MKEFHGRVVAPGCVTAPALVSHGGLNTLASFQKALQFGDKNATCGDQNNPDLYGKPMAGKALCLPQTIGSTTGGLLSGWTMPRCRSWTAWGTNFSSMCRTA